MDISQLQQLADDFGSVPPDQFEDLADTCRQLGINRLDVRFLILEECFRLSASFWGEGDSGAVSHGFAIAHVETWNRYLQSILQEASEEVGTHLALALREELVGLGNTGPLAPD
jgi:hypothetical protein